MGLFFFAVTPLSLQRQEVLSLWALASPGPSPQTAPRRLWLRPPPDHPSDRLCPPPERCLLGETVKGGARFYLSVTVLVSSAPYAHRPLPLSAPLPPAGEVSEAALVRDILYVFQGIDGKFIKMSAQDNCYKIDSKVPEPTSFCPYSSGSRINLGFQDGQLSVAKHVLTGLYFPMTVNI